jgi:hypothetical protein
MQKGKRGDVDGVEDGSSAGSKRLAVAREESAIAKHSTNPKKLQQHGPSFFHHPTTFIHEENAFK